MVAWIDMCRRACLATACDVLLSQSLIGYHRTPRVEQVSQEDQVIGQAVGGSEIVRRPLAAPVWFSLQETGDEEEV